MALRWVQGGGEVVRRGKKGHWIRQHLKWLLYIVLGHDSIDLALWHLHHSSDWDSGRTRRQECITLQWRAVVTWDQFVLCIEGRGTKPESRYGCGRFIIRYSPIPIRCPRIEGSWFNTFHRACEAGELIKRGSGLEKGQGWLYVRRPRCHTPMILWRLVCLFCPSAGVSRTFPVFSLSRIYLHPVPQKEKRLASTVSC